MFTGYLREERNVAKGTFQEYFYAIRFLYVNTLNCDRTLFTKIGTPNPSEAFAGCSQHLAAAFPTQPGHIRGPAGFSRRPTCRTSCPVVGYTRRRDVPVPDIAT